MKTKDSSRKLHYIEQNIFDSHEFDYGEFEEAFRLVFYENNYKEHYNKMMKN